MCKRYFKFHTKTLFLAHWKCRILCQILVIFVSSVYSIILFWKENRYWKSSYTCESLWSTCFTRNNVQRLVSTFQKWGFRPQQQRPGKTTEKICRCGNAGISGRRFNSNPQTIGKSIESWLENYFQTLTCDWKDPERRKMDAVRIKRKTLKGEKPLVKFCSIVSKDSHFCIALLMTMKSGSISTIPSVKNHG